jgi:cysteine desulfurase
MRDIGVSLLSLSAHKFYGPKGVGALIVDRRVQLEPLIEGGGQERGHRSGTVNVAGCVGAGAAAALASDGLDMEAKRLAELRDELEHVLTSNVPGSRVNGGTTRLPNTTNVSFQGTDADAVIAHLPRVAVSSGSACSSASPSPSHVLLAMGRLDDEARSAIRFSLGRRTSAADITVAAAEVRLAVEMVRARTNGSVT